MSRNTLSEAVSEVFEAYQDTCKKIEPNFDANYIKTEVSGNLDSSIHINLSNSSNKQLLRSYSRHSWGVLKDKDCGEFPELRIKMDCEDHHPGTSAFGWTGASYVDGDKNVILDFCIVPGGAYEFTATSFDYAILNVYDRQLSSFTILRYFDNEDDGTSANLATLDGVTQTGAPFPGLNSNYFSDNDILEFTYFPKISQYHSLPDIHISYGVLGRFGPYQGFIYTDDEDTPTNKNCVNKIYIDANGVETITYDNNPIPDVMELGTNTKLFISKISYCN